MTSVPGTLRLPPDNRTCGSRTDAPVQMLEAEAGRLATGVGARDIRRKRRAAPAPIVPITLHAAAASGRSCLLSLGTVGDVIRTAGPACDRVRLVLVEGAACTGDVPSPAMANGTASESVTRSWTGSRAQQVIHIYPGHSPLRPLAYLTEERASRTQRSRALQPIEPAALLGL